MNINFVYTLVTSLAFTVVFDVNDSQKQNYFLFGGEETSAHLFRVNDTVTLYLGDRDSNAIYQTGNINSGFTFSWDGYLINNMYMNNTRYIGNLGSLEFDSFTFLSPLMEILETCVISEPCPGSLYQCEGTKYGLVTLIVLGIGLLLKFDTISPKVRTLIRDALYTKVSPDETIHEEMESLEEISDI